ILAGNDALGSSSTTAHAWTPGFSLIFLFKLLSIFVALRAMLNVSVGKNRENEPNTRKQEKERRTRRYYLKYEESRVKIKSESISKNKKFNYSSFQDLRSSCNEDMVKYEGPQPSTTRARALNEKSNKKIPPATSQPPG
ncbi:hypothetical protein Tco_1544878, partial [Tanacetum coccineum]